MRNTPGPARRRAALWGLAALVSLLNGCANKPSGTSPSGTTSGPAPIIIGEYGSMTGPQSTFGTSTDNGIQLALADANKAGGVHGHPLQLAEGHAMDDQSQTDTTLSVVQKMTSQDNPTAVLGEVASTLSLTAAPVCQRAGIPMISPSSTNPKVTQIGDDIFRVCFVDQFQGKAAAEFAINNLKAKKAAVLTDIKSDYSTGLTRYFTQNFQALGGKIVASPTYSAGALSFSAQLQQIKSAGPDVIFVPGYYTDIGPIAKQAHAIGLTVPFLGGDGWDSKDLVPGAGGPGGALEGSFFTDHYSVNSPDPLVKSFVGAYQGAYKAGVPDAEAALGYDAAGILVAALRSLPAPADGNYASPAYRSQLRGAIASTKNYKGVTGTITIGPDRNAVKPVSVLKIVGNQFQLAATINP